MFDNKRLIRLILMFTCLSALANCASTETASQPTPTDTTTSEATFTPKPAAPTQIPATATAASPATHTTVPSTATDPPTSTPVLATDTPTATPEPTATQRTICGIQHVVIISIDGLRPDALDQAETPILDALRKQGSYTGQAEAVFPTVTLINHASMIGGMTPEKHGITWNSLADSQGKINGPTLFSLAHDAGFNVAMVSGKPKLEDVILPNSVDTYVYGGFTDRQVLGDVLPLLEGDIPDVLFMHFPDVDSAGHATGWMSLAQLLIIQATDGVIGDLVAALEKAEIFDQTLMIITTDHGGSGTSHGSDSAEDTTIPWLAVGPGVKPDSTISGDVVIYDTAATVLYALNLPIPESWDGQPILEIFDEVTCSK